MSHSYSTRKFLNIKDKNIIFPEDYFEEVKLNGITSFVFKGILSYQLIVNTVELFLIPILKSMGLKLLELSFQKYHSMIPI